eukprot:m.78696 g.78696  ORF g.78696 m.78696 type:complete len:116 (-) comp17373_c1_seq1:45-392(-)
MATLVQLRQRLDELAGLPFFHRQPTLRMVLRAPAVPAEPTHLSIRTLVGRTIEISAQPGDTILHLKHKIAQQQGWDAQPDALRLICKGRLLEDEQQCADLDLSAAIFLVLTMLGG